MPTEQPILDFHNHDRLIESISRLPGRARVAYAARCARRAFPLLFLGASLDAAGTQELFRTTGSAVALADAFAAGEVVTKSALQAVGGAARTTVFEAYYRQSESDAAFAAVEAVAGAAESAAAVDWEEKADHTLAAASEAMRKARTTQAAVRSSFIYRDSLEPGSQMLKETLDLQAGDAAGASERAEEKAAEAHAAARRVAVVVATASVVSAHHAMSRMTPRSDWPSLDATLSLDYHRLGEWAKMNRDEAIRGVPRTAFDKLWAVDEPAWSVSGWRKVGLANPFDTPALALADRPSLPGGSGLMTRTVKYEPVAERSLDEPLFEEVHAEWNRFHRALAAGRIDPDGRLFERFVAFFDNAVVDADPDPTVLRVRAAAALGVHPDRLVISYLG